MVMDLRASEIVWMMLILLDLRKDPRYRKYVQSMDKILQSFDAVSEWADVIGFLSRLLKVRYLLVDKTRFYKCIQIYPLFLGNY